MTLARWAWSVLGATLVCFDLTGFGPWMVSQPMVCGPLFGWWLGHTVVGVILGGIVQLLWMDVTPVGVGIPYDATATTLVAVYIAALETHASLSQMAVALFIAVPFGFLFKWMDSYSRRVNTILARWIEQSSDERLPLALDAGMAGAVLWYGLRYALSYGAAFWSCRVLWRTLAYMPRKTWIDQGWTLAVVLLPVAGMGVVLELLLSDEPERRWAALRSLTVTRRKAG